MHPFQVLGLPRDAGLPAVKRAYAQLLRKHRPDEDPQGFQRVHEAYVACVAIVAARARADATAEPVPATEPAGPVAWPEPGHAATPEPAEAVEGQPAPLAPGHPLRPPLGRPASGAFRPLPDADDPVEDVTQPPAFSLDAFVADLLAKDLEDEQVLPDWLRHHEPLYSMTLQQTIAGPLLNLLLQRDSLTPEGLDIVLGFFGLDFVGHAHRLLERQILALRDRARSEGVQRATAHFTNRWPWLPAFMAEILQKDAAGTPVLQGWLQGHARLQDEAIRRALARPIRYLLVGQAKPLSPDGLRIVFQTIPRTESTRRLLAAAELAGFLESRSRAAWSLRIGHFSGYQDRSRPFDPSGLGRLNRCIHRDLTQRFNPLRRLAIVVNPVFVARARALVALMVACPEPPDAAPGSRLSPWWRSAVTGAPLHWARLVLVWGQLFGLLLLLALPVWMASAKSADFPLAGFAIAYAALCTALAIVLAIRAALAWLRQRFPRLHMKTAGGALALLLALACSVTDFWPAAIVMFAAGLYGAVAAPSNGVRWLAFWTILAGLPASWMLVFSLPLGTRFAGFGMAATIALPIGLILLHDVAYARVARMPLEAARRELGWLAHLCVGWIVLAVIVGLLAP